MGGTGHSPRPVTQQPREWRKDAGSRWSSWESCLSVLTSLGLGTAVMVSCLHLDFDLTRCPWPGPPLSADSVSPREKADPSLPIPCLLSWRLAWDPPPPRDGRPTCLGWLPPCLQAELCTNSSSMDGNVCGGLVTVKVCCSDFQHNPGGPAAHFQSRGRSHGRECSVSAELEAQGGTNQNRDPGCQFRPKSGEPSIY